MNRARHAIVGLSLLVISFTLGVVPGGAHKPITSPFTYNEDVFPILRQRCASCHVPDGVAPMSLMTYEDTVPWGESIRVELLAGHMPPWSVDTAATRFRNVRPLSAREINVLLTWATGGTPLGNPEKTPQPVALERRWSLGTPDLELPMPREFTLPEGKQEDIARVRCRDPHSPNGVGCARSISRLGLRRSCDRQPWKYAGHRQVPLEHSAPIGWWPLWLPGDEAVATDDGTAFELPAGAELLVRVRYKKTWQYERKELRDRSTIGLYFARDGAEPVRALAIGPSAPPASAAPGRQSFTQTIDENVRAVAIYANEHPANAGIVVTAVAPDGARRELIAFHPRRDWSRRYWFNEPISLVRGTRLETTVAIDDETPLPLGPGTPPQAQEARTSPACT